METLVKAFYVYRHVRLDTDTPFYVGKGKGKRAYHTKGQRNQYWHNIADKVGYRVEIVKYFEAEEDAFAFEMSLIKAYKKFNMSEANLTDGGEGMAGYKWPEDKLKQRAAALKANTRKVPPRAMLNKKHTQASKDLMSKNRSGKPSWNKGLTGIYSEAVREKMAAARRGTTQTPESNLKRSINSGNKRKINMFTVTCKQFRKPGQPSIYELTDFVRQFDSITEACNFLQCTHQPLMRVLSGERPQYKGFTFQYVK